MQKMLSSEDAAIAGTEISFHYNPSREVSIRIQAAIEEANFRLW